MTSIGLFDSGIGGFSVLKETLKLMPGVKTYYISDEAHAPYGDKSEEYILERCHALTKILIEEKKVDLVVVACNTATAVAIADLRKTYPQIPFVGIEPYLNIQKRYHSDDPNRRFVVLTTARTGKSEKFKKLKEMLDPDHKIDHYGMERLATLIEEAYFKGMSQGLKEEIEKDLAPLKEKKYTHVILGCTHYPLISSLIENYLQVECINPAPYVALRVQNLLLEAGKIHLPLTGREEGFQFLSTKKGIWEEVSEKGFSL